MSEQQNLSGGEIVDKASDLAQQNPDAARSMIDKVEDAVDTATGGRFSEQIDKAGDLIEDKLGLPNNQGGTEPAPGETSQTDQPAETPQIDPTPTEQSPGAPEDTAPPAEPVDPQAQPAPDGDVLDGPPQQDPRE